MLYDVSGNILYDSKNAEFADNMTLDYAYDAASNANYIIIRVFQTKKDGTKQYPFVRSPGRMRADSLMQAEDWQLIINAGLGVSAEQPIDGIVIENGVVKYDQACTYHVGSQPLTIDSSGTLGYAAADASADTLAANGIVSAVCGFCPIVENFQAVSPLANVVIDNNGNHFAENAQRQIIGQFGNGDYAIISCEGRNYDNSDGWTLAEAQAICIKHGLKFAYNLDGGKSTCTIVNKKILTHNYMTYTSTPRSLPTYIVFNGTTAFAVP